MNKTEARYAAILASEQRAGMLGRVAFEGMRLKWGEDKDGNSMHYTPDFCVWRKHTTSWVMIEVKGAHVRSRDIVRFKGCRADWPEFLFEMWQYKQGEWRQLH